MEKTSRILITGAAGLVGSALVEHLHGIGYTNVIPLSRKECDLTDAKRTIDVITDLAPDFVFHAAARVYGIVGNMENKGVSFFDNVTINTNVVEACRIAKVKKITVMGTGAVYPYPSPGLPLREEMIFMGRPHPSENSYAQAKRAMLAMLEAYEESYGLKWAYIISCNLFGPRDKFDTHGGHVVPSLIKKFYDAKKFSTPVSIWGDGSSKRDFLYIEDVAVASELIMRLHEGPLNIGSGQVFSIREIVENIAAVADYKNIVWDSSMPNGQDYRGYDLTNLNRLGFKPQYSILDGVRKTWEWYCDEQSNSLRK